MEKPKAAATYTVKLYYQNKPNASGKVPLSLKYYYGKQDAIGLGISAFAKDVVGNKIRMSTDGAAQMNELIRTRMSLLEDAACSFEVPTWDKVKPLYLRLVAHHEEVEKELTAKEKKRSEEIEAFRKRSVVEQQLTYAYAKRLGIEGEVPAVAPELYAKFPRLFRSDVPLAAPEPGDATEEENKLFKEQLEVYVAGFKAQNHKVWQVIKSWAKTLLEFEQMTEHKLTFKGMNARFYNAYETFLFEHKDFYNSTFSNHISRLKMFLSWNVKQEIHVNKYYTQFKEWEQKKEVVYYLTDEELNELWAHALKTTYERRVRDIFMFANLTGLRISDVVACKFRVDNGVLKGTAQKVDAPFAVPVMLDERIEEILKKYSCELHINKESYNTNLKRILRGFFLKKYNKMPFVYPVKHKRKVEFKPVKGIPLCDVFSSHNARMGFCSRMFAKGFDVETIGKMLGARDLNLLRRKYISFNDEELKEKVAKVLKQQQPLLIKATH